MLLLVLFLQLKTMFSWWFSLCKLNMKIFFSFLGISSSWPLMVFLVDGQIQAQCTNPQVLPNGTSIRTVHPLGRVCDCSTHLNFHGSPVPVTWKQVGQRHGQPPKCSPHAHLIIIINATSLSKEFGDHKQSAWEFENHKLSDLSARENGY